MNRYLRARVLVVALILSGFFTTASFAQLRRDRDFYTGEIVSINLRSGQLSIKDRKTGLVKAFKIVDPIMQVSKGDIIFISTDAGSDVIKSLRKNNRK